MKALLASLLLCAACSGAASSSNSAHPPPVVAEDDVAEQRPAAPRVKGPAQPQLPIGRLEFEAEAPRAPYTIQVEVASTEEQRQKGLMFREHLAPDAGMLFIFPTERHNSFWMHNTLIPLDMFFIDSEWTVVGIVENAEPLTDTPRGVGRMSQYVLEVNAGFAKQHGYTVGQKVRFVPPGEAP